MQNHHLTTLAPRSGRRHFLRALSATAAAAAAGTLAPGAVGAAAAAANAAASAGAEPDPWLQAQAIIDRFARPLAFREQDFSISDFGAATCATRLAMA